VNDSDPGSVNGVEDDSPWKAWKFDGNGTIECFHFGTTSAHRSMLLFKELEATGVCVEINMCFPLHPAI